VKITGKTYDLLKALAQIYLPALGTLYFALAGIWGLPAAEQVTGSVLAIDTFLGVVLGISAANYANPQVGDVVMEEDASGMQKFTLALNDETSVDKIGESDEVRFKVVKGDSAPLASASRHRTGRRRHKP
jgi:hypothetical protein